MKSLMRTILALLLVFSLVGCSTVEYIVPETSEPTTQTIIYPSSDTESTETEPSATEPPVVEEKLELTLHGDSVVVLEYDDVFTDPGAEAYVISGTNKTAVEVQVTGRVVTKVLGTQKITYTAVYQALEQTACRTVVVQDSKPPVITLTPDPDGSYILPGEEYQEAGFTAFDNYDGDITDKVVVRTEGNRIAYSVSDTSGNSVTVYRDLVIDDPIPPEIILQGATQAVVERGTKWADPGFQAQDNVDGDLTASVRVSGTVDTNSSGTYVLTYEVSDSYGNTTTVTRKIVVKEVQVSADKVIYLTFDDGPSQYTEKLLAILEKYQVKATFFVVNTDYMHLLDDIVAGGHSLALHTYSHRYDKIYVSEKAFYEDLYRLQDVIFNQTGLRPTVMRFPGGSSNRVSKKYCTGIMTSLAASVPSKGFQYFDWNVDSDDAGNAKTSNQVFENVKAGVSGKKHSVVLQHDTRGYSVDAVEQIILWGLENGYTFLPLEPDSPECHHGWIKN